MTKNEIIEARKQKTMQVLCHKAKEYATDADRYHNFRVAADLLGWTPEEALFGMLAKHWVSMMDIVDGKRQATIEMIDEKFGDAINYLILLDGLRNQNINFAEIVGRGVNVMENGVFEEYDLLELFRNLVGNRSNIHYAIKYLVNLEADIVYAIAG